MNIMWFIVLAWAVVVAEAAIESVFGDKRHWPSFVVAVIVSGLIPAAIFGVLFAVLNFVAARVWFDLVYNYFKRNPWDYLGEVAATDKFIAGIDIDPRVILAGRIATSGVCYFVIYLIS